MYKQTVAMAGKRRSKCSLLHQLFPLLSTHSDNIRFFSVSTHIFIALSSLIYPCAVINYLILHIWITYMLGHSNLKLLSKL